MKYYFLIGILALISSKAIALGSDKLAEASILEKSVGKVVLSVDSYLRYDHSETNPFGIAQAFLIFRDEYHKNIKTLSVENRVSYFWAALWHLSLQGGYLTEFEELVLNDCVDEFIEKLSHYVGIEEKLQRDKTRLALSNIVFNDLKILKENQ